MRALSLEARRRSLLTLALGLYLVSSLVSMAVMSVGVALLVIAALIAAGGPLEFFRKLRDEASSRWGRLYLRAALALTTACAVSLLAAMALPLAYGGRGVEVRFFPDMAKAWYLFWPLAFAAIAREVPEASRTAALRSWLLAFCALSVLGVAQHFWGWPRPQRIPGNEERFHATLFLGHHLSVASIFIFPLFLSLDLAAGSEAIRRRACGLPRWTLAIAVLAGVGCLLLTYSRMLWVSLPIGLAIWLLLALPRRWALAAVVGLGLVVGVAAFQPVVQQRMEDGLGVGTRTLLWNVNREFFAARPLTGTGWHHNLPLSAHYLRSKGFAENTFVGHAHNNALEMLGSTGVLGAAAWLAWSALAIALAWRSGAPGWKGWIAAWAVFHLNGLTQVNFWESKVLHQMMIAVGWSLFWIEPVLSRRGRPT